jgi:UDP-2-acetamido-2-deoxy-ribo-hexuluronate aminotransferase
MTNDEALAEKCRVVANHGQTKQYYHEYIGLNSRLDAMQAAVLNVKLPRLDAYCAARQRAAAFYDAAFAQVPELITPARQHNSTHVFHQYTLQVTDGRRDALKQYLQEQGIPAMIYYPVPLYRQNAFKHWWNGVELPVTEHLCQTVISLPMHTELTEAVLEKITGAVIDFFKK